ncbi:MAG: glycosyltransferase, partial [Phycisphaerales bacterium]
ADLEAKADGVHTRVVRAVHGGLSHARNEGVRAAKAPWVVPLDSDDMLHERALELFVQAKKRVPGAAFITAPLRSFDTDPARPVAGWYPLGGDRDMMPVLNAASSCVALLEREAVLRAGGYDTTLPAYEDWDLYCTLVEQGGTGEVIPEFLVLHRLRPDSMMHTLSRKRHHLLRARLMAKHPQLTSDPSRTLRLLMGDAIMLDPPTSGPPITDAAAVNARARELIRQNVRYRLADKLNNAMKSLGLQHVLKRFFADRV